MNSVLKCAAAIVVAAFVAVLGTFTSATAQDFPSRPVRIIVPYAAGGAGDTLSRVLGLRLGSLWGQQPIIDNRAGANGLLGSESAARSEPDGYTLYMGTDGPMTISASLYKKLNYNWKRDFAPISMVALLHQALIVNPKLEAHSVQELIALAKKKPGVLNYGSIGIGSSPHLGAEMFKAAAQVDITHVPYRGSAPAISGLLAGDVDMFFVGTSTAAPFIQNGTLRGLAITAGSRLQSLPDVPTFTESGLPLDVSIWFGLFAPANTPAAIVKKINADIGQILADPDFKQQLQTRGFEARSSSPAELAAFLEKDYAKFHDLIERLGLQVN